MDEDASPHFFRELIGAFRYPLQGDGPVIVLCGTIFFSLAGLASGFAGIAGIVIEFIVGGFVAVWARDVVKTSATGTDTPPGWADFSDWQEDLIEPLFESIAVVAISFGPFIALQWKKPEDELWRNIAIAAATGWGYAVFPIMFLALALTDSIWGALNPLPLIRAVWVTFKDYALLIGWGFVMMALCTGITLLLEKVLGKIPLLPDFISMGLSLYLLAVGSRGIGLFYRRNHETLEWY